MGAHDGLPQGLRGLESILGAQNEILLPSQSGRGRPHPASEAHRHSYHLLADTGIAGVAAIQPFTCLPGTMVSALSGSFRRDHEDLPWINVEFDGQEDTSVQTRLQASMHQVLAATGRWTS